MVKGRLTGLIDRYDIGGESQATLHALSDKFQGILASTRGKVPASAPI